MDDDAHRPEEGRKLRILPSEMIDPNRSIDKDHSPHCALCAALCAAARRRFGVRLRSSKARQARAAFARDERAQRLSNERRALFQTGQLFRLFNQLVIKRKRCAHDMTEALQGTGNSIK